MKPGVTESGAFDTPEAIEELQIERYRQMSPAEKLGVVFDLSLAARQMAEARIRDQYGPDVPPREVRLRLAALHIARATMIEAFGWDPEVEGY